MDADSRQGDEQATVPLRVQRLAHVELARTIDALGDLSWLGRLTDGVPAHPEFRRVVADLELPILDGSSPGPLRKATLIDVGLASRVGDHVLVDIAWQSASLAPLFPVFAGQLLVSEGEVVLDGRYAPPLGSIGLLLDQALLRFVARRTASALLDRLAREFEGSGGATGG